MNRWLMGAVATSVLLSGCATVERGSIPVVEASGSVYDRQQGRGNSGVASRPPVAAASQAPVSQAPASAQDSGVVVMVPGGGASSAPIQAYPAPGTSGSAASSVSQPITATTTIGGNTTGYSVPSGSSSGVPGVNSAASNSASSALAADEQLDGPVLALLTTAQQEQGNGNLESAASSLERAQRIAPREPQVLYRLAEVRLAQGDAAQAEQLARRALTYASGRPALQASLWNLIAQARERQGDAAGAAQARERARVNL
ncbi:tetratricopeptide repeat protein [Azotobacter vinelandii]|uniref:tetratricopeptide repeat protein n=1 Tax=Azotobacter vinelandii TaxID=354 RepID=UPI0018D41133|nr:tetratricopeptide repeat protein [Azotobacter vinelandii]